MSKKQSEAMLKRKAKFGYINSPETREKLREANLGKKASKETKKKLSVAAKRTLNGFKKGHKTNVGRKFSDELKKKLSKIAKGKKHPNQTGEKHPNWQGGITPTNLKIRNSAEFKLWRGNVFERDKYICQMPDCDKTERYLNAHHIKLFSKFPELRFDTDNGITLCKKCHLKIKSKEEKFENMFIEIIKMRTS